MCGRYYIEDDFEERMKLFFGSAFKSSASLLSGDVTPAMTAPVMTNLSGLEDETWGFPNPQSKGLIINARAESVRERAMFRHPIETGRIVIPSSGFYEWNTAKEKSTFTRSDSALLFMAGIREFIDDRWRFTILTTAANHSMEVIHDRMPLILEPSQLEAWLSNAAVTDSILQQRPVELRRTTDYEQLSLF